MNGSKRTLVLAGLVPANHAFVGLVFKMVGTRDRRGRDGSVKYILLELDASNLNPWAVNVEKCRGLWL
jgi:hypothetical protein